MLDGTIPSLFSLSRSSSVENSGFFVAQAEIVSIGDRRDFRLEGFIVNGRREYPGKINETGL